MGSQPIWGTRESRRHRLPQTYERSRPRPFSWHPHYRRGIYVVAHGFTPHLSWRPGLLLQMEHGLDARYPFLLLQESDSPQIRAQQADLLVAIRLLRKFRPALFSRRSRAREELTAPQNVGRHVAAVRQPTPPVRLSIRASRQEAAFHGSGIRAASRMERGTLLGLASARPRSAPRRTTVGRRPQPPLRRRTKPSSSGV